jgi:hypothetical protein
MAVTLVLSGSLLAGCDENPTPQSDWGDPTVRTNNTFNPQHGYWHSYYHHWYPYPHNYYEANRGYFFNGRWSSMPDRNPTTPSEFSPSTGGHRSSGGSWGHSSGISRGGFGSSGHSSS